MDYNKNSQEIKKVLKENIKGVSIIIIIHMFGRVHLRFPHNKPLH